MTSQVSQLPDTSKKFNCVHIRKYHPFIWCTARNRGYSTLMFHFGAMNCTVPLATPRRVCSACVGFGPIPLHRMIGCNPPSRQGSCQVTCFACHSKCCRKKCIHYPAYRNWTSECWWTSSMWRLVQHALRFTVPRPLTASCVHLQVEGMRIKPLLYHLIHAPTMGKLI